MRLIRHAALLLLITAAAPAWALPSCYADAQTAADNRVPADIWLQLTPAERNAAGNVRVISAVDSTHCRTSEVLAGNVRVSSGSYAVPFGFLYGIVANAIAAGDKEQLVWIADNAKPADKNVSALLDMFEMPPPGSAGGWSTFKTMVSVFRVDTPQAQWLRYGLIDLYRAMGGRIAPDCDSHVVPIPAQKHFRSVLSRFGLKAGRVNETGSERESVRYGLGSLGSYESKPESKTVQLTLEGCLE